MRLSFAISSLGLGLVLLGCAQRSPDVTKAEAPPVPPTPSTKSDAPPPTPTGPVAAAPSATSSFKRKAGKLTMTLTVENTSAEALRDLQIKSVTLNKKPLAGFPVDVKLLAPHEKFAKDFSLSGVLAGKAEQSIELSFFQGSGPSRNSAQMGDTVTIP